MKKAAIFGAGTIDVENIDFQQYKFIAGCDGGTKFLSDNSICPHVFIGDFDSLDSSVVMEMFMLGVARRGLPAEKDFTDMKGTVDFVSGFDYDQIDFYGATGTRLDHSFGNMMLLIELFEKGIKGRIINSTNIITAVSANDKPVTVELNDIPEGWYVSIVPIGQCEGVSLKGLKYKAENLSLGIANATQCISNEIGEGNTEPAILTIETGKLLVFYSRD